LNTLINLNKARKARLREQTRTIADQNVVLHGRTKAQRVTEMAQNEKAAKMLDQHQMDDDPSGDEI
jgi:hypothetical protein